LIQPQIEATVKKDEKEVRDMLLKMKEEINRKIQSEEVLIQTARRYQVLAT